ncbi:hypothetical protein [Alkalihalobacterium alkalinitrilicum]|uniref:hypothetical protein n=1 Tax=Alkalihalobacterium alkalinitrilicum TaxID=427920 RepID=UPI000A7A6A9B|nr:hypothetical protein [Alkalihalobacterium alkalinitrilicum]
MTTEQRQPTEFDRYTAAHLNPELLNRVIELEKDLQAQTNKDVILIAYEESEHNPT